MLTESCVMFFSPSRAVLIAILRDEYLNSAVRTKEGEKAGSNQPPARDPVQFKLELTPNYLISYLENTGSRSTRYVSMPHPNESSILPKFLEKSDPEVARPAFSTWPEQKSQPTSIQIHQSAYRDQTNIPVLGRVVVLNSPRSRYADWWIWIDAHTSNAFGWDFCTGHVKKAGLPTSGSLFSRNFGRIELSFGLGMDTYRQLSRLGATGEVEVET